MKRCPRRANARVEVKVPGMEVKAVGWNVVLGVQMRGWKSRFRSGSQGFGVNRCPQLANARVEVKVSGRGRHCFCGETSSAARILWEKSKFYGTNY